MKELKVKVWVMLTSILKDIC